MENPKLCIDCKHHQEQYQSFYGGYQYLNICIKNQPVNIIDGKAIQPYKFCESERENALRLENERCGYKGIYWEPKISWNFTK